MLETITGTLLSGVPVANLTSVRMTPSPSTTRHRILVPPVSMPAMTSFFFIVSFVMQNWPFTTSLGVRRSAEEASCRRDGKLARYSRVNIDRLPSAAGHLEGKKHLQDMYGQFSLSPESPAASDGLDHFPIHRRHLSLATSYSRHAHDRTKDNRALTCYTSASKRNHWQESSKRNTHLIDSAARSATTYWRTQ